MHVTPLDTTEAVTELNTLLLSNNRDSYGKMASNGNIVIAIIQFII